MNKKVKLKIGVIIENEDGKIFLQKEKFFSNIEHKWNFITGSFEKKDGSMTNTAIRECQEEANIEVKLTGIFKILTVDKPDSYRIYIIFTAKPLSDHSISHPSLQEKFCEDIIEQRWFAKKEILAMDKKDFVTASLNSTIRQYADDNTNILMPVSNIQHFKEEIYN
jgi:8-oxo-dGTP pyrophosphatase MutT (NUDIX family)